MLPTDIDQALAIQHEPRDDGRVIWTLEHDQESVDVEAPTEAAARAAAKSSLLTDRRVRRSQEIIARLAATDVWAARSVEDGVPMPAAKINYRKALRVRLAQVRDAADAAAIDAVVVPDPPAPLDA